MNANDIETLLYETLHDEDQAPEIRRVQTYEEAGIMTTDRGLVVRTEDGSEFQITIVRSR